MSTIHLIEGPVGAGKSTFASKLSLECGVAHLDLDEWMVTLFRPDRPQADFMAWYAERKRRCIEQIWLVACGLLELGSDVILELGLVQLADREDFYRRVDGTDYELAVHLLQVPKSERWARVQQRNQAQSGTFKMEVSAEIFEIANGAWQAPDESEIAARHIETIVWERL